MYDPIKVYEQYYGMELESDQYDIKNKRGESTGLKIDKTEFSKIN